MVNGSCRYYYRDHPSCPRSCILRTLESSPPTRPRTTPRSWPGPSDHSREVGWVGCRERGHGLQEPQTSGHRNLSWEKKWHDSEGTQPGLQHPLLGLGLPRGCGERRCIPRLPLRAPCAPTIGPGKHQSRPCGALCPDVSSQQVLVSAWLGQTLDVTKGRESSHQALSKPPGPALSPQLGQRPLMQEAGPVLRHPHLLRRQSEVCLVWPLTRLSGEVSCFVGGKTQETRGRPRSPGRTTRLPQKQDWEGKTSSEASAETTTKK